MYAFIEFLIFFVSRSMNPHKNGKVSFFGTNVV